MNFIDKFPQHLAFRDAMTIWQETHITDQLPMLPYLVLEKIMMSDIRCRSCLYQNTTSQSEHSSDSDSDDEDDGRIHPVDCLLAVIHCCDDILRQDVMTKLSLCQLAVPLLLPNPVDDSVTFLLWAIQLLAKSWKKEETMPINRLVKSRRPIVSFIRLGALKHGLSKSSILNNVMGNQEYFFNWDCEGGNCERNFVDGLVELCCYYPSGKDTDFYSDAIIFLNLRGDAQLYPRQVEFLQKISTLSVVLIAEENMDEDSIRILHRFSAAPGGIVLLLDKSEVQDETKEIQKKRFQLLDRAVCKDRCSKLLLKDMSMVNIKVNIQQIMVKTLKNVNPECFKSLSACCHYAFEANIKIDEDNEHSKTGRKMAGLVMEKIQSVHNYDEVKHKMLPLQGLHLWQKWASLDKAQHCGYYNDLTIAEYNSHINKAKKKVRKSQFQSSVTLTPLISSFVRCLKEKDVNIRKYFLRWLKILVDDHSMKIMSKLHSEYLNKKEQLLALNDDWNDPNFQCFTSQLHNHSEKFIIASFGLEHLFREMGQIYESRMDPSAGDVPDKLRDEAKHLTQVMAEIIAEGHPLELMDGDASHVPVTWVLAVIEKLKVVCEKNAKERHGGKMFVLSVLGISNAESSTLLYTLFGLQCNVGAGRYTRGAYMQLLPINNSLKEEIDCDYMLIVRTEGLCSPELHVYEYHLYNTLATFIISIADAIIINVFGESTGDFVDVLQSALYSLVRLRKFKINPSCTFVYHYLDNATKHDYSQKWQNLLDSTTQAAAKHEYCEGLYRSFSDIIRFNSKTDVFYLPRLYKEDQPMAPLSLSYIESARKLKSSFMTKISAVDLETFKLRVKYIWLAILEEESSLMRFKNITEVNACSDLKNLCNKLSWTIVDKTIQLQDSIGKEVSLLGSESTPDFICGMLNIKVDEAMQMLATKKAEYNLKMETFVNSNNILFRWYHHFEIHLHEVTCESQEKIKRFCHELSLNAKFHDKMEQIIHDKVLKLAYMAPKQFSNKEIEEICIDLWDDVMIKGSEKVTSLSKHDIEISVVKTLIETLPICCYQLVIKKLTHEPLNQRSCLLKLNIDKSAHICQTQWHGFRSTNHYDVLSAAQESNIHLTRVSDYLRMIKKEFKPYNSLYVYEMLQDLFSEVDKFNTHKNKFAFTPEYKVDLALVACVSACDVFKQTTKKVEDDNNLRIKELENIFLTNFKHQYKLAYKERSIDINFK